MLSDINGLYLLLQQKFTSRYQCCYFTLQNKCLLYCYIAASKRTKVKKPDRNINRHITMSSVTSSLVAIIATLMIAMFKMSIAWSLAFTHVVKQSVPLMHAWLSQWLRDELGGCTRCLKKNVHIIFLSRVSILLLTRGIDIVILSVRPSVPLSVRLSVTRWYCMKTA